MTYSYTTASPTHQSSWLALVIASLLLLNFHTASAQHLSSVQSRGTGQQQPLSLASLTDQADVVAVGKVGSRVSEWNEDKSRIRTLVTISVDEAIKGSAPGSTLTVVVPGGEVDGVGEWYSHTVQFQNDEDVIVFANKDNGGHFVVTNGEMGKFSVQKDKQTGAKIIPNVGTLETFKAQIRHTVKMQETDKKDQ